MRGNHDGRSQDLPAHHGGIRTEDHDAGKYGNFVSEISRLLTGSRFAWNVPEIVIESFCGKSGEPPTPSTS